MILAHLKVMQALIETVQPCHLVAVTGTPAFPYSLLWAPSGVLDGSTLDDARTDLDVSVGVTTAGVTADQVFIRAGMVRDVLVPPPGPLGDLTVAGRRVWLRHEDSRPVQVDRDVTFGSTNAHPLFAVDTYRLISTPA